MKTWIALLRAVNVGGTGKLPMKGFATLLEELGAEGVRTYVQSGNAVFRAKAASPSELAERVALAIEGRFSFKPKVIVLGPAELEEAMARNPFPEAEALPTSLHLGFLAEAPKSPDLAALESLRKEGERFLLLGAVFYLHASVGVGGSKLAAARERLLGVPMTDRNWRTVCALRDLARETES